MFRTGNFDGSGAKEFRGDLFIDEVAYFKTSIASLKPKNWTKLLQEAYRNVPSCRRRQRTAKMRKTEGGIPLIFDDDSSGSEGGMDGVGNTTSAGSAGNF